MAMQYLETYSINRFKEKHNVKELRVIKSPKTGSLFFTCPDDSSVSGKVSTKEGWQDNPVISKCMDDETQEVFFLLHRRSEERRDNIVASF